MVWPLSWVGVVGGVEGVLGSQGVVSVGGTQGVESVGPDISNTKIMPRAAHCSLPIYHRCNDSHHVLLSYTQHMYQQETERKLLFK